ncbi:uncharacterized protein Dsimw501_GD26980 [Drosophila simulans]|nr:uncharacterized protein Dsimw501_GD26980 [Drosophila simulans]
MPWLSFVFVSERGATVFCSRIRENPIRWRSKTRRVEPTKQASKPNEKRSKSTTDSLECACVRVCECRRICKIEIGKTMQQLESSAHLSATQRQQHQRQQNQQQRESCAPGKN